MTKPLSLTIEEKILLGAASTMELEGLGVDRVKEIKTDSEHVHYRGSMHLAVKAEDGKEERRVLRLIASTDDKDYHGDRIRQRKTKDGDGWVLDGYLRNGGVYLWCHNMGAVKAPIGQALKTWVGKIGKAFESVKDADALLKAAGLTAESYALMQDVEFLSADDGPDDHFKFSETVYLLMSGKGTRSGKGMMGSSVGFVPIKAYWPETSEEREKLGLGTWGVEFREQALLENSATPTPANPFASVLGGKKSFEARVLEELDYIEDRALIPKSLLREFRERAVLGPTDAAEKLSARIRSRVFFDELDGVSLRQMGVSVSDGAGADGAAEVVLNAYTGQALEELKEGDGIDLDLEAEVALLLTEPGDADGDHQDTAGEDVDAADSADAAKPPEFKAARGVEGDSTITLDSDSIAALQSGFDGAELALATFGAILDAIEEKNTDPDLKSSIGVDNVTNEELAGRIGSLEQAVSKLVDSLAGAKVTARTAVRDDDDEFQSTEITDKELSRVRSALGL